jgi:hypothetical protein
MYSDSKKIQLIEEVLRLDDPSVIKELEAVLKRSKIKTKTKPQARKQKLLYELRESIKEVGLAKKGKIKLQSAKDFLNEL